MSYAMIMTSYEIAWSSWECAWHRPWLRTPLVDTIQNKQSHQASSCFLLLQASLQALFRPWPWFLRCHFAGHLPYLLPNGWRHRLLGPFELFRVSYPCPYQAERRDRGRVIPPKPGAASTIIGTRSKGEKITGQLLSSRSNQTAPIFLRQLFRRRAKCVISRYPACPVVRRYGHPKTRIKGCLGDY